VATGSATWGTLTYELPESFLARVDEAVLIPSNLSVATADGALLLDGLHAYSRRSLGAPHFLHESPDGRMLAATPEPTARIDDEAILLGGDGNFAHGVLDWLSRAFVLDRCPELAALPVLVAATLRPGVLDLLAALGVAPERLVRLPPGAVVSCRRLWVPSLTHRFQYMAPEYLDFLRARAAAAYGAPAGRPWRRLYLARPAAGHRALLNESEVLAALRPLGVEPLRPEELSMAEQVRRFAEAELIVMPVGGGSAGIAFAPPTAGVVELTHGRCVLPQYGILAALLGQRYEQLVGPPVVNRGALNFDWDFTVPPEEVAAAAERVLGRRA
jgi:capsular polysaccharide biosynthesis protein